VRGLSSAQRFSRYVLVAALSAVGGCATYADRLNDVRSLYVSNDLPGAQKQLEGGLKRRCDRDVLKLDRAMILLSEGKPREAEQQLREVRDTFDRLQGKAYGEKALSMLTDAESEAYKGEDYEQVLIRAFLCLSNLMSDGGDAVAYALQTADKQQQIIDAAVEEDGTNPKKDYQRVAVGAYLHGAVREASHTNYDDVERAATVVCSWQPDFAYGAQDLERAKRGHHSAPGFGVLYVMTLVGVGPHKEEVCELPSTVSLLIADRIFSALGNQTLPPNIAPVKVPQLVRTPHEVDSVAVSIGHAQCGRTATITDVGSMALKQYEAVYPRIVAEAVVRRLVKKGVIYGAKELIGTEKYSWQAALLDVAGVAWEATESADTRCWGLLPDKIQVLRLELPAGSHSLGMQSLSAGGYPLGRPVSHTVEIADGRNTYLLANFPYGNLVGTVLTNTP
jgi:hypothetical protein